MGNQPGQISQRLLATLALACSLLLAQSSTGVAVSYAGQGSQKEEIRIDLIRWSTDAERDQVLKAWTSSESAVTASSPGADNTDPFGSFRRSAAAADDDRNAPAAAAGKGRGKGKAAPAPPKKTPAQALNEALTKLPTVGYVWTTEIAGYSVKYASRIPQPGGGERVLILTGRPMPDSTDPFSAIELRLPAKGLGEGRAGKLSAKSLDLDGYDALPVTLKSVRKK